MSGIILGSKYKQIDFEKKTVTLSNAAREFLKEVSHNTTAVNFTKSPWANRCISIRMNTLSSIPWVIERKELKEGERTWSPIDEEHELWMLLKEINPEANFQDHLRASEADMLIFGAAFWLKIKTGQRTSALMRLNPQTIEVIKDQKGIKGFVQDLGKGVKKEYTREQILYFREYHPEDDLGGLSLTEVAQNSIEVDVKCTEYIQAFFENFAMPPVLISPKGDASIPQSDLEGLRARWNRWFRGANKQHKTAFMAKAVEATMLGYPIKDLALEQVRAEARRDICAVYGVPPAIAGAWEAANYASADEQRQSLYTETVIPRATYLESVLNAELVRVEFGGDLRFRWKIEEIDVLQPDRKSEAERVELLVRAGIMNVEGAAEQLDIPEEHVGEGPQRWGGFEEESAEEERAQERAERKPPRKSAYIEDMEKWRRKALKRLKAEKDMDFEFESEYIPLTLGEAIAGALELATDPEEVKAVFDSALNYEDQPRDEDVNDKQYQELKDLIMMMGQRDGGFKIQVNPEQLRMVQEYQVPELKVNNIMPLDDRIELILTELKSLVAEMASKETKIENIINTPQQKPPVVNVKTQKPEVKVNPQINVSMPKLQRSSETQEVRRGKKGELQGSTSETTYEYEGEE